MEEIEFRLAKTPDDFAALARLAKDLAAYHCEDHSPTADKLAADHEWFSAIIASHQNIDIGFVGWHRTYACQIAERSLELQNLFVITEYRKHRVGVQLVAEVVREALQSNCSVIKIGALKSNPKAIAFYNSLGCTAAERGDTWRFTMSHETMITFMDRFHKSA